MGQYTGSTVCECAVHSAMSSMIRTCLNMHLNQFMCAVLQMLMLVNIFQFRCLHRSYFVIG